MQFGKVVRRFDTAEDVISGMVFDLLPHIVVTQSLPPRNGKTSVALRALGQSPVREVKGRISLEDRVAFIALSAVRAWANETGIGYHNVLTKAHDARLVLLEPGKGDDQRRQMDLLRGMDGATGLRVDVLAINLQRLGLETDRIVQGDPEVVPINKAS